MRNLNGKNDYFNICLPPISSEEFINKKNLSTLTRNITVTVERPAVSASITDNIDMLTS